MIESLVGSPLTKSTATPKRCRQEKHRKPQGPVVGTLVALHKGGKASVTFSGSSDAVSARSVDMLDESHIGSDVVLIFENDKPNKPIIIGVLQCDSIPPSDAVEAEVDGSRIVLTADRTIVLRCGHSSITLTSAGKIIIRGEYVVSRASGVNRIKGGVVRIN